MKVLHVVKTSDGARWAAWQAQVAARAGVEIHVAVPSNVGDAIPIWEQAGAHIHVCDASLPTNGPWLWPKRSAAIRDLVATVKPDIIHSHFVTTTLALRRALGTHHHTPRLFQVPGPLHLQHKLFRALDIRSAGQPDRWIASSRCIRDLYIRAGIDKHCLYLSYYGTPTGVPKYNGKTGTIRKALNLQGDVKVVGSISYMYPPKYFLGQTTGLKRHEDMIDAIAMACEHRSDLMGVIIGSQWGGGTAYRERLQRRAFAKAGDRIRFLEALHFTDVPDFWEDFDCVVHIPMSENCGGVVEPLAARVPTIASKVGGLPEVVIEGETGWLVPPRSPASAAQSILEVLSDPLEAQRRAAAGQMLVREMFDIQRTGKEIVAIYQHVLGESSNPPPEFDAVAFMQTNTPTVVTDD
jgi:glycosyltransferase involved in cell wall biosynthesis